MFLLGSLLERARHCSRTMTRGLDMRVLDVVNTLSFAGFGWETFAWVRCTGFADGGLPMGSIPDRARVMGDLMGRHFGWVVDFCLGGAGEGKRNSRARLPRRFRRRIEFHTVLYVLYYILHSLRLARKRLCTPRIGDSKYRCPWNMVTSHSPSGLS